MDGLSSDVSPRRGGRPALDLKRMFRLRTPLMLGVFLALAVPSVLGSWLTTPLEYEASTVLRFLASTPRVLDDRFSGSPWIPYDTFLNTQINLITGPGILSRVLEDPEVQRIPEIAAQSDPLNFARKKTSAWARPNSELVRVSFRMRDKNGARFMLQKITDTYMDYALGEEANVGGERLRILSQERDARETELEHQLRRITALRGKLVIPWAKVSGSGPSETEMYREGIARAEEDRSHAATSVKQTRLELDLLLQVWERYETAPNEPVFEMGVEDRVTQDPRVQRLRQQFVDADANLAVLLRRFRESSPKILVEKEKVESLRAKLAAIESPVRGGAIKAKLAQVRQDIKRFEGALEEAGERRIKFQEFIDDYNERALKASMTLAELEELKVKADETRGLLKELRHTITVISLEGNAPARVKIASQPGVPSSPDYGNLLQLIALSLAASMAAGLGAGLVRELTDKQARCAQDLHNITTIPVLATIPHTKAERLPGSLHVPMLMADHPDSPSADEYRRILAGIVYPPNDIVEVNTCLVSSPTRGDGRTSVSCNVAIALAQADRKVLLIDTCSRDPRVEWSFGLEPGAGLAEVIQGTASPSALARPTEFESLHVLGPGFQLDELREKLASRDMLEFLELMEKEYDHVIIDTPPALLMSVAKMLAPIVDGVIVVVGVGRSSLGMTQRCLQEFEQVDAPIIGLVLNGAQPTRGGYMRANLDRFYDYSNKREIPLIRRDFHRLPVDSTDNGDNENLEPTLLLLSKTDERPEKQGPS